MSNELQALTEQVKQNTNAEQSAVQLIQGLAQQLANSADNPAAINALAQQLKTSADALAAAVVQNTQAQVTTPSTPMQG